MSTTWTTDADESITVTAGSSSTSNSWTTEANTKGTIATSDSTGNVTVTGTLDVSGDTEFSGGLTVTGNEITFGNGETIDNNIDGVIQIEASQLSLSEATANVTSTISTAAGYDGKLQFSEGGVLRWTIGNDGSDNTNYKLHFDYNNSTVGSASKLNLDSTGNLTTANSLIVQKVDNGDTGGSLDLFLNSSSPAADDTLGIIKWQGYNTADTPELFNFATIKGISADVANSTESGNIEIGVRTKSSATEGSAVVTGFKLEGTDVDNKINATIGNGAASMTTIAGDLDIDGDEITTAGNLDIDCGGALSLDAATITEGNGLKFLMNGTHVGNITGHTSATQLRLYENIGATTNDYFNIAVAAAGATTISTVDAGGHAGDINISPDGDVNFDMQAGHVEFDGCGVGFDLETCSYDATNTLVDFRTGNKQMLTFDGGNITNLFIYFPNTSGNFTLLVKQDGNGSRTITNWNAYDVTGVAANGSSTVKFAGGSNPDLTDDANHVDIVSFFWDTDTEIAYGVATLDFQF